MISIAPSISPESSGAKAFPPSPVTPSPVTPLQKNLVLERDLKSAKHLSQLFKKGRRQRPSTTDVLPLRQKVASNAGSPGFLGTKVKEVKAIPFTEWKPPPYKEPSVSSNSSPKIPPSQRSTSPESPSSSPSIWRTAEERAKSYFALIDPTLSSSLKKSRRISSPQTEYPSLPFANYQGVTQQRNVPYPIRTNSLPESPPKSHFSPTSPSASEIEGLSGVAFSLRSRAKKALMLSKGTKRPGLKPWMNFSQNDVSCVSSATLPTLSTLPSYQERDSMQQSLSEVYDTLEKLSTRSRGGLTRPALLRADHTHPSLKSPDMKDLQSEVMAFKENQKLNRKSPEVSKSQAFVYRIPRKRLSKPQVPAVPTTASTKSPDTTYKIEMPTPQTPQRPDSSLFFAHVETTSPKTLDASCYSNATSPNKTSTTRPHHLSRSSSGSASHHRLSHHPSQTEKHRMKRHSVPTSAHSRSNTDDSTPLQMKNLAMDSNPLAKSTFKPAGQKWKGSLPMLGLATKEADAAFVLEHERGRTERRDIRRERTGSGGTSLSAERRREALKKRIRVMGDPSAVGIPF